MRRSLRWLAFAVIAAGSALWLTTHRAPRAIDSGPKAEIAIQDGKTIDFSSGNAVVRDDAREKIERSVAEMEAAARSVTFAPKPAAKPATDAKR